MKLIGKHARVVVGGSVAAMVLASLALASPASADTNGDAPDLALINVAVPNGVDAILEHRANGSWQELTDRPVASVVVSPHSYDPIAQQFRLRYDGGICSFSVQDEAQQTTVAVRSDLPPGSNRGNCLDDDLAVINVAVPNGVDAILEHRANGRWQELTDRPVASVVVSPHSYDPIAQQFRLRYDGGICSFSVQDEAQQTTVAVRSDLPPGSNRGNCLDDDLAVINVAVPNGVDTILEHRANGSWQELTDRPVASVVVSPHAYDPVAQQFRLRYPSGICSFSVQDEVDQATVIVRSDLPAGANRDNCLAV